MKRNYLSVLLLFLLLAALPVFAADASVQGTVHTSDGLPLPNAEASLLDATGAVRFTSRSDASGRFTLGPAVDGSYVLRVRAHGFAERRMPIRLERRDIEMRIEMLIAPVHDEVSVTATPGRAEEVAQAGQPVNIINRQQLELRATTVVAEAAAEEEGLHLQRTSPTIASIYVRGLTGNKVNVFVDGVRYSTGAQRGGINTFFDLIQASDLEAIEVLRGPSSAQYGSDALGGSVQFVSLTPSYGADQPIFRGRYSALGGTADASFGQNVMLSYGTKRFGVLVNLDGKRVNTLRTGQGLDSHSAYTRFFGLPSDLYQGSRRPDTAFTQYGGLFKAVWAPDTRNQLTLSYARSQQDGGKRYDQLEGGDGNLIAELNNLKLDLLYLRWDRQQLGGLDQVSLTYSFNAQREERINQGGNGNPLATIVHEPERTTVHGVQGYLQKRIQRHNLQAGAEYYQERLFSRAFGFNPVTSVSTARRPRVPHNAAYRSGGFYLQDIFDVVPQKLRLLGSVRYGAASYRVRSADSPLVGGLPLWPDDSLHSDSVTFRAGVVVTPLPAFSLYANVSRGYRSPHMTDLGTLGLTGNGFEIAALDVAGLGATVGSTASASAVSTGRPVEQVRAESSLNYEGGVRVQHGRVRASLAFFHTDLKDNIEKQALILPPGAVGLSLGGQVITDQSPTGTVFVAASTNPVLVRANLETAMLRGVEHQGEWRLGRGWTLGTTFTWLYAEEANTGLPPNIEGDTPATDGYLRLRYEDGKGRWWIEPYLRAAARQDRISSLALEDRRTGAMRTRTSIRNFFRNGATARGLVSPGPDNVFGNADDFLLATGETLAQIQDRVLGVGVNEAPLFTAVPGYATFNLRGGMRVGERHTLTAIFSNIGDRDYRGVSWGVDAPGRGLTVRYAVSF